MSEIHYLNIYIYFSQYLSVSEIVSCLLGRSILYGLLLKSSHGFKREKICPETPGAGLIFPARSCSSFKINNFTEQWHQTSRSVIMMDPDTNKTVTTTEHRLNHAHGLSHQNNPLFPYPGWWACLWLLYSLLF